MRRGGQTRPVRVLYFITELNVGGAERSLTLLLARLDRARFVPVVACLYGSESPVASDIRALGVPVHDLGMESKWRLDAFWRFYRLLRRERPVILHTLLFHANIPGRVIGRLAGVPIVISGERTMGMESGWRYALNRMTQSLADRVVCVSSQVADFVVRRVRISRDKVVVIPNGVDLSRLGRMQDKADAREALGLPVDGPLIGTVARLNPVKRLDLLLRAVVLLEGVAAVIVGYGPEEERLKALAAQLAIADRVLFAGQRRDICSWLAALDVFVLSSDWEGMPNAVLEAMAAGLPVVTTAVGGTRDVVLDRETGLLVPPDDPSALGEAIQALLSDAELRRRMGRAGRQRVVNSFSAVRLAERTQALYEEVLADARRTPAKELG